MRMLWEFPKCSTAGRTSSRIVWSNQQDFPIIIGDRGWRSDLQLPRGFPKCYAIERMNTCEVRTDQKDFPIISSRSRVRNRRRTLWQLGGCEVNQNFVIIIGLSGPRRPTAAWRCRNLIWSGICRRLTATFQQISTHTTHTHNYTCSWASTGRTPWGRQRAPDWQTNRHNRRHRQSETYRQTEKKATELITKTHKDQT